MSAGIARTIVVGAMIGLGVGGPETQYRPGESPRFEGRELVRPEGFDEWPLAGASLGLSYSPSAASGNVRNETFHRVYVNPSSYRSFRETGRFPEGTTFVLELYEQADLVTPARHGRYEGERVALEVSVKDRARFPEGWAYFDFANGAKCTAPAFDSSACQACHVKHAAADSVFVQFYPRLRERVRRGKTPG